MPRILRVLSLLLSLLLASSVVLAQTPTATVPTELAQEGPITQLQGQGRLSVMTFRIYEARLWTTAKPVDSDWSSSLLALELIYAHSFSGASIAKRSIVEMQRQGEMDATDTASWLAAMKKIFPDVKKNDRISVVNLPGVGARFYYNGKHLGEVLDVDFAKLFIGIWLSPQTSEPALRSALLGESI